MRDNLEESPVCLEHLLDMGAAKRGPEQLQGDNRGEGPAEGLLQILITDDV